MKGPIQQVLNKKHSINELSSWKPFVMLLYREIRRFGKVVVQTVITPLITSSLYLLIFGVSLGKNIHIHGGMSYLTFIIPGLLMMGVLNNAFQNCSSSIVAGKFSGEIIDLKVSPLSMSEIVIATSLGGLVRGVVVGLITFIVGEIFHQVVLGAYFPIEHPFYLLFFIVICGMSFGMLGLSVALWAKSVDQLSAVSSFILTPLIYLGGVFFSLKTLHPFWQKVSLLNPLLYFIDGVRYSILGVLDVSLMYSALVSLAALVFFYFLALTSLKNAQFSRW